MPALRESAIIVFMSAILHIFPSTAAVEAFQRRAIEETGVQLGISALTLRRLAEEIRSSGEEERRLISHAGRKLLLEEMTADHYREGTGLFARLSTFPGFVGALDTLFAELKQSLISPDELAAGIGPFSCRARLTELAALFRRYNRALSARGMIDRHDLELAALRRLREVSDLPPLFDGIAEVAVHAIYDLTPLQLALVASISRHLPVRLHLPYNPDRESLYAYAAKTAEAIEALDNSDLLIEPVFTEPAGRFLTPLLDALFAEDEKGGTLSHGPGPMAVMAAPGAYRECEEIGRRIRGLLERGVDPTDVAVLFRDLKNYGPMLEDVCRRFRIPVSYRRGAPLSTSPLVKACLAPFDVLLSRFARDEIVSLCNSDYMVLPEAGLVPGAVEEVLLDASYLDETIESVEQALNRRITGLRKRGRDCRREEHVLRFLRPLLAELRRFRGEKTLSEFTALLDRFIDNYRLFHRGIAASEARALKRDASAVSLFRRVLADLEADIRALGMAGRLFSPAAFAALLKEGMEGVYLAGERSAGVAIMNFHDARGLSFAHLFVAGLNEGIVPKRHDGHPLFRESDKLQWQKATGRKLFRTAAEKALEEPLLFWMAVGCAASSLTFSYSYVDSRGNEMLRSPFLDDILAIAPLPEARIPVSTITPPLDACLEREELLNALAAQPSFTAETGKEVAEIAGTVRRIAANAAIEREREAFFAAPEESRRALLSSPYTGTLRRPDIVAELAASFAAPPGNSFAPTALEEYGCCPFRFFLQRLLALTPREKPDLELEAKEQGSLVHELLYAFFQRLAQEGELPLRDTAAARAILRETAEELFGRWEKERYTGEPLLWEVRKERLMELLEQMVELEGADSSGFVPCLFEHSFSGLEVTDSDGTSISLTGKIDRADTGGDGRLRVVDYKMAGDRQKYRDLLKRENLGVTSFQMPVYLLAAVAGLEQGTEQRFGRFSALYWLLARLNPLAADLGSGKEGTDDGFFSTDPVEREQLGDDNFLNRLCAVVRAIKGGDFQITPRECEFCPFRSVCRYVEVRLREEE